MNFTKEVINIIKNTPQCIESVKSIPCYDYEARFKAFIHVKHGIITTSLIDWTTVMNTINSQL
jgi:hypothetical protein